MKIPERRVGLLHGPLLDPGLQVVLGRELEHLARLGRGPDAGPGKVEAARDERPGRVDGKGPIVRVADVYEGAAGLEEGKVGAYRGLCGQRREGVSKGMLKRGFGSGEPAERTKAKDVTERKLTLAEATVLISKSNCP